MHFLQTCIKNYFSFLNPSLRKMREKYVLLAVLHFVAIVVIVIFLNSVLCYSITCYFSYAANALLCVILARCTFYYMKFRYLGEKVSSENKAVFITGCDSGFGHLLAKRLDSKGFQVFAGCLFPSSLGVNQLRAICSSNLKIVPLDVKSDKNVQEAYNFVRENLGLNKFWAVVNNAGIQKGFSADLATMDEFRETLEVNAMGPVRVVKAFLPLLRKNKGRIVNLTSLAGTFPTPHMAPYIMSKFAAQGFTDCLRQELEIWGIEVVCVQPELFKTAITSAERINKEFDEAISLLDEDTKNDYGDKYFQNFKKTSKMLSNLSSNKLDRVVDDLECAVSSEFPHPIYRPRRSVFASLLLNVMESLPITLRDLILKLVMAQGLYMAQPKAVVKQNLRRFSGGLLL